MPFSANDDLPKSVKDNIPSKRGKDIFREVVNSSMEEGRSETVAFASAWAALQDAGFEQNDNGKWIKKASGARPLDGQITLGPEVFENMDEDWAENLVEKFSTKGEGFIEKAVRRVLEIIKGEKMSKQESFEKELTLTATVLKSDQEQRIVWGWASVISENGEPIYDTQGDRISPDVLTKMANDFMLDVRKAKAMHEGNQVGEVIHSLPLTKDLGESLGIQSSREGWIIAMKIHDEDTWQKVKSGEYKGFSIGGAAVRVEE